MNVLTLIGWTVVVTSLFWLLAWAEAKERDRHHQARRDEAEQWKRREEETQR